MCVPIYDGSNYNNNSLYSVVNCDGSITPSDQFSNAITQFQNAISEQQIDCSDGFEDACNAITSAYTCLNSAVQLADSNSPWPLPPATDAQDVNAFGGQILQGASNYIGGLEQASVGEDSTALGIDVLGVTGTMLTMVQSYNSCTP